MRAIFNMDGPVFEFLSKLADIVLLNVVFIICCIPIITIGASLTAMSYVTLKMREGEEGYIVQSFFKSFKQNFKQATVIWLLLLSFLILLIIDFRIMSLAGESGMVWNVMKVIVLIGGILWIMMMLYVFPVLARFVNTIRGTMRNAMLMSFANAPKAILTMVITVGMVLLTIWNTKTFVYGILVWFLAGFALLSYINSMMQLKLFHKFMPEKEEVQMTAGSFSWENDEEWKEKLAGEKTEREEQISQGEE